MQERLEVMYMPQTSLSEARFAYLPMQMLVCPSDGSGGPHCGYGGVDTSPEMLAVARFRRPDRCVASSYPAEWGSLFLGSFVRLGDRFG